MSLPFVQLPLVALILFHTLFHFTPTPLPFPSCFNSITNIAKKDPLLSYTYNIVNLSYFDNLKSDKQSCRV
jgi:hypothetical protein